MTTKQATSYVNMNRNPNGKGGFGEHPENINETGRPKNSLKTYVARKLAAMTDREKDQWLKEHKISGETQWKMGEGNPSNELEHKGEIVQKIVSIDE